MYKVEPCIVLSVSTIKQYCISATLFVLCTMCLHAITKKKDNIPSAENYKLFVFQDNSFEDNGLLKLKIITDSISSIASVKYLKYFHIIATAVPEGNFLT